MSSRDRAKRRSPYGGFFATPLTTSNLLLRTTLPSSSSSSSVSSSSTLADFNGNTYHSGDSRRPSSYWLQKSKDFRQWLYHASPSSISSPTSAKPTPTSSSCSSGGMDTPCTGFEPQNYLRDRCKKCFRLKSKHDDSLLTNISASASYSNGGNELRPSRAGATAAIKKERRKSWRDRSTFEEGADIEGAAADVSDTTSVASFKSATSKGLSSAKSLDSIADTKSMVTALSGDDSNDEEDRIVTPTESDVAVITNLRSENEVLREEIKKLRDERRHLTLVSDANGNVSPRQEPDASVSTDFIRPTGITMESKLKSTEDLCNELMIENEALKAEIRDLQNEVEEMQDQYREEEIEEFRELQRELEQNAKNCRVLQFKLRKAERQRDQVESDRDVALLKLRQLGNSTDPTIAQFGKQKELESELRIAKEVSVRLHTELEAGEEKRIKLEDEVFYYKEKCRELQTQGKWREARNKADQAAKRQSAEILDRLGEGEIQKELRDVLERENDLREQLRFTEEDLRRSKSKLAEMESENEELERKLVRLSEGSLVRPAKSRPPMIRSASEGSSQVQLAIVKSELDTMRASCELFERKNISLSKKMLELEINAKRKVRAENGAPLSPEFEADLTRLLTTINDLEKKNTELTLQLKKTSAGGGDPVQQLRISSAPNSPNLARDKALAVELRAEQERRKELEIEAAEYKALLAKSDNRKLISMATRVEILQNHLVLANDRCLALHKKAIRDADSTESVRYAESMKERVDLLEKHLSETKAAKTFSPKSGEPAGVDEVEQCCVVLASIEAQTNRIQSSIEKLDPNKSQRRRSNPEHIAALAGEIGKVASELQIVKGLIQANPEVAGMFANRAPNVPATPAACTGCEEATREIDNLKEEVGFYKKKNKELTNQVLETEDRWSREIEKQTHGYRTQIHGLDTNLEATQSKLKEQTQLLESVTAQLAEKKRVLDEEKTKSQMLQATIDEHAKKLAVAEKEQKYLKEWEIKYKKLEKLFDQEKEKSDAERTRAKNDVGILKKRTDEAVADLQKLQASHQRREALWSDERQRLERQIRDLKSRIGAGETLSPTSLQSVASTSHDGSNGPSASSVSHVPVVNYKVTRMNTEGVPELKAKLIAAERRNDDIEAKMVDLRIAKEEVESQLSRTKIAYDREKETLLHKVRTDDKLRVVQIDALQQKFASRMSIMENTNKSLHTQLTHTRRERDHHREAVATYEKRIEEKHLTIIEYAKKLDEATAAAKITQKKIAELESEVNRLTVELSLSKDAHKADKKMWKIEKSHYNKSSTPSSAESTDDRDRRITEDAIKAAEDVRKQYSEYQKLYTTEVARLNAKMKEIQSESVHKEFEMTKAVKGLREQIKVLEIDQRNLMQAKEMQVSAREVLQADQERLLQIVQQSEMQKLARKYKIAAVIDQLISLPEPLKRSQDGAVLSVIDQLSGVRTEDCQTAFTSSDVASDLDPSGQDVTSNSISIRSAPHRPGALAFGKKSFSIESTSTMDSRVTSFEVSSGRANSPRRLPDPPPSTLISRDRVPEYDKDGRLHYIPRSIARTSTAPSGVGGLTSNDTSLISIQTKSTGTWTEEPETEPASTGTNILYKIRREELAKGNPPSVRSMAKAFDAMDTKGLRRGFFSIRKSRSVDTTDQNRAPKLAPSGDASLKPVTPLNRNTTSMSQIELGKSLAQSHDPSGFNLTLPRGGRNPFKNMGAKIVDRVRRSLSRTRNPSEEPSINGGISTVSNGSSALPKPPSEPVPVPPKPVTKKMVVKKKVPSKKPVIGQNT